MTSTQVIPPLVMEATFLSSVLLLESGTDGEPAMDLWAYHRYTKDFVLIPGMNADLLDANRIPWRRRNEPYAWPNITG